MTYARPGTFYSPKTLHSFGKKRPNGPQIFVHESNFKNHKIITKFSQVKIFLSHKICLVNIRLIIKNFKSANSLSFQFVSIY